MKFTRRRGSSALPRVFGLLLLLLLLTGCGYYTAFTSYYNIYYNVKRRFVEAEREYSGRAAPAASQGARPPAAGSPPGAGQGRSTPALGGAEKYRRVIESGSKLLEFYPKSRWIDDTLLLMGISYYRMGDFARSERKFAELVTVFPKSEHVPAATIWKARVLSEQKRDEQAIADLNAALPQLERRVDRAAVEELLGDLYRKQEDWSTAAGHYENAISMGNGSVLGRSLAQLGQCRMKTTDYAGALEAFAQAAPRQADPAQAFDCELNRSRCQLLLGDFPQAERTLLRLRGAGQFAAYLSLVNLELADLAAKTGRVDDAMLQLARIVEVESDRAARARAFYRLGTIHRDQLADLPQAKSLMDSALASGADRETADSARAAAEQITRGLTSLDLIKSLQDSITVLTTLRETAPERGVPAPVEPEPAQPVAVDSLSVLTSPDSAAVSVFDSSAVMADTTGAAPVERKSPAALAADSLLRALDLADSLARSRTNAPDSTAMATAASGSTALDQLQVDSLLALTKRKLQQAYIKAGEFYDYTLDEPDSARHYFAKAAASDADPGSYWKANLRLARLAAADTTDGRQRAAEYYQAVLDADSVSVEAANEARTVLGLPTEEPPASAQEQQFRLAEAALLDSAADINTALAGYRQTVLADTTTEWARRALHAQIRIYDEPVRGPQQPDSAIAVATRLLAMFPDQKTKELYEQRILPDDSGSVFYYSEEELQKRYMPVAAAGNIEEAPNESGWPPPEESLRGRRYR